MKTNSVVAVIMAGGLGKRMESDIPKVLHKVNGIPMINHILIKLKQLCAKDAVHLEKIIIVVGKYKEQIQSIVNEVTDVNEVVYVTQPEPKGTGHAIMCCKDELLKHPESDVLILSGDVPLLSTYTIKNLLNMRCHVKLIVTNLDDPNGYGRIVIKDGKFDKIVGFFNHVIIFACLERNREILIFKKEYHRG